MATDLYKLSPRHWVVRGNDGEIDSFNSIDAVCDFLEAAGIPGEEVDTAIIHITAHHHSHAHFGSLNGFLLLTDDAKIEVGSS